MTIPYSVGDIFGRTIRRIHHFEGSIGNIIGTPLIETQDREKIEKMQEAIQANRAGLIEFLIKVFEKEFMACHLADKIQENCFCMKDFYLNFDSDNRNKFLFNEY